MKKLLIAASIFLMACGCAPNPNGVKQGQWVKHLVTGEEYFLSDWHDENGTVELMKDRQGNIVRIKTNILELTPLVDPAKEASSKSFLPLIFELEQARIALDAANTPTTRTAIERVIEKGESAAKGSPVFRKRKWNHSTGQYE